MKELYQKIYEVLEEYRIFNQDAMISMQAIQLNGFKRLHRFNSNKLHSWIKWLGNELYDCYRMKLAFSHVDMTYDAKDIKEHLKTWDSELSNLIGKLIDLNKEFFEKTGVLNCYIKKTLCMMKKNYEKVGRWYKRFEKADWEWHDISMVDYFLHEKIKRKEKKYYGKSK